VFTTTASSQSSSSGVTRIVAVHASFPGDTLVDILTCCQRFEIEGRLKGVGDGLVGSDQAKSPNSEVFYDNLSIFDDAIKFSRTPFIGQAV
jgi:hypothetical protein